MKVSVEEAKIIFPDLCELARSGLDVVIYKDGQPYMRLAPCEEYQPKVNPPAERKPGLLKGKIWMAPDFDAPLKLVDDTEAISREDA